MIDIHCHILPGVDDGSGDLNDSVEMAQIAYRSGVSAIVATPHCNIPGMFKNYNGKDLSDSLCKLRSALEKRGVPVSVCSGQEVFLSSDFAAHLEKGDFVTLNGSRYMLVELDFRISEAEALAKIKTLVSAGYVPVVAHPERYSFIIEAPERIERLHASGAFVQLNRSSLLGDFGPYILRTASYIMSNGLADFVASDAHSQYRRTPDLSDVHEVICENWSYDYADLLLNINPLNLLDNKTVFRY